MINYLAQLKAASCDIVIHVDFFGPRSNSKVEITKLIEMTNTIIKDDAQSFPISKKLPQYYHDTSLIVLTSFGYSKPLAATGGGAMIFCGNQVAPDLSLVNYAQLLQNNYFSSCLLDYTNHQVQQIIQQPCKPASIGIHQSNLTSSKLSQFNNKIAVSTDRYKQIIELLPRRATLPIHNITPFASIFAIYCTDRANVAQQLAAQGIESTWYYLPLNSLDYFQHLAVLGNNNAYIISKHILILPFQAWHTNKQFNILIEKLSEIVYETI